MNFNNLNLNLSNYDNSDLIKLFSIEDTSDIDKIISNKNNLLNQINKEKKISSIQKKELEKFINNAANKILLIKQHKDEKSDLIGTWSQTENPITEVGSSIIINNPNRDVGKKANITDGRMAGSDQAPPGWLNPINVKTITTGMNIDSRFRDNYYGTSASNFTLDLPVEQKKVVSLRLATIEIPMSYYAVQRSRGDATILIVDSCNCYEKGDFTEENVLDLTDPSSPRELTWDNAYDIGTTPIWVPKSSTSIDTTILTYNEAWLVILPDGNYDFEWRGKSDGADITNAMNNALGIATKGVFFKQTGKFFAYKDTNTYQEKCCGNEDESESIFPDIHNGLNPTKDLCYSVDRISGRSIFAVPTTDEDENNCETEASKLENGFTIYFNVDQGGSLNFQENIQLFLGWQLGFRVGSWTCNKVIACISESPCMITGPRYMFISIDDGVKNSGSNFLAAFSQSTLAQDIITRINLSSAMLSNGVYSTASDIGLSNQLNRTREYFGPVMIRKLHIKLLDEYGRLLSFNDVDWSMSIVFEKLYD